MIRDRIASCASDTHLSRRSFLGTGAAIGGGLMLSLSLPFGRSEAASSESFAPNAFIRIGGDGQGVPTMSFFEKGQGRPTSIPVLVARKPQGRPRPKRRPPSAPNKRTHGPPPRRA